MEIEMDENVNMCFLFVCYKLIDKLRLSLQPTTITKPAVTVEISEGSAKIISENRVFYNPVQQFNRDLSISVLSTFWKLCQIESEQRQNGKKVPGTDFLVCSH